MLKALVTNDDGYKNAGIRALLRELSSAYEITAVAPAHEQSWVSKSISRHRELNLEKAEYHEFNGYTVDGTPADCTQLGLYQVSPALPDFVVSGINVGSNVGYEEILSSGTVGAALEAALQGVPAFATLIDYSFQLALNIDFSSQEALSHFEAAAKITNDIIGKIMDAGFPASTHVISINIPWGVAADAQWVITKPHSSRHEQLFEEINGKYKHRGGVGLRGQAEDDSDMAALKKGCVLILPLNLQLTTPENQKSLSEILACPIFK